MPPAQRPTERPQNFGQIKVLEEGPSKWLPTLSPQQPPKGGIYPNEKGDGEEKEVQEDYIYPSGRAYKG